METSISTRLPLKRLAFQVLIILAQLVLLAQGTTVVSAATVRNTEIPDSVNLAQWETQPSGKWIYGNLGSSNSDYMEGEVVPFRLELGKLDPGANPYTFSVCREYFNDPKYGYLFLDVFDKSRSATPGGTISSTSGPFSGVNVTINSYNEVGGQGLCDAGKRETQVSINIINADTESYVLWGGHLASPLDTIPGDGPVGSGHSAGFYPGASLHMTLLTPAKSLSINPGAILQLAEIVICKSVTGGSAQPWDWGFSISPNPNGVNLPVYPLENTSCIEFLGLPSGSYEITETSLAGYVFDSLDGVGCTFSGSTATCTVAIGNPATNANTTFHNKLANGTLTVNKVIVPSTDTGKFNLLVNDQVKATDVGNGGTTGALSLSAGTYTVSETAGTGTSLSDYVTTIGGDCAADGTVAVTAGSAKTCTITNTRRGTIIVEKLTDPTNQPGNFTFTGDAAGTITAGQTIVVSGLAPGTYTSTETTLAANFSLASITCSDANSTGDVGTKTATFKLEAGETVTCTFTDKLLTPNLMLGKAVDNATVTAGDTVGFTLGLTNTGEGTANNVTLTDELPAVPGVTWTIDPAVEGCSIVANAGTLLSCTWATLAPGANKTIHVTGTTTSASCGAYTNSASAQADNNAKVDVGPVDLVVDCGVVTIAKTPDDGTVMVGDNVVFTILVKNTGTGTARGVTVTDTLPTDFTWTSNPGAPTCTVASGVLTCNLGDLAAGATSTITLTAPTTAVNCGPVTNTASVTTTNNGTASDTGTVLVQCPSLSIDKTAIPTTYSAVGDVIHYSYLVTNTGNTTLTNVTVVDDKFTVTCPAAAASMAPDATVTCTASYTITQADLDTGKITNTAYAKSGTVQSPPDTVTVTAVQNPELTLTKSASPVKYDHVGQVITYTYVLKNTGNVTLSAPYLVSDDKVASVTCPATPATLAHNATVTCTGTYIINASDITAGKVVNVATATANFGQTVVTSNQATATVTADLHPAITISKTPDLQKIKYKGTAKFTIVVTNTGNVALTNVRVTDPLAPYCARTFASLAVGESKTYTCWVAYVTKSFTNVATVTATPPVGADITASDTAVVQVLPAIEVDKCPVPSTALFTGSKVSYCVVVKNKTPIPVTLTALVDDKFGNVDKDAPLPHLWLTSTCDVPRVMAGNATYSCKFTAIVKGEVKVFKGGKHVNTLTAAAVDANNNTVYAKDTAVVKLYWRGRTPAMWAEKTAEWPKITIVNYKGQKVPITPTTLVTKVFKVPAGYLTTCNQACILDLDKNGKADTLLDALNYANGTDNRIVVRMLLRAATAGLLNKAYFVHSYPAYPTISKLLNAVNQTLATRSFSKMLNLSRQLDWWNKGKP